MYYRRHLDVHFDDIHLRTRKKPWLDRLWLEGGSLVTVSAPSKDAALAR